MKIARVLLKALGRPRVALERDGALYDVEQLERATRQRDRSIDEPTLLEPCDFHTRVATLRGTGLYDLDMDLIRGSRPSTARIRDDDAMLLAPCDTERASLFHVDVGGLGTTERPVCRIGEARALLGQDALAGLDEESGAPDFAISLAAVIGDDLSRVTPREASNAVMGLAILVEWASQGARSPRGSQLGPYLVSRYTMPKPLDAEVQVTVRGERHAVGNLRPLGLSIEEAIAFASGEAELRAGDAIAVGPLPGASARALGVELTFHDRVEVAIDGLGTLRGIPVPKKPHLTWRSSR